MDHCNDTGIIVILCTVMLQKIVPHHTTWQYLTWYIISLDWFTTVRGAIWICPGIGDVPNMAILIMKAINHGFVVPCSQTNPCDITRVIERSYETSPFLLGKLPLNGDTVILLYQRGPISKNKRGSIRFPKQEARQNDTAGCWLRYWWRPKAHREFELSEDP